MRAIFLSCFFQLLFTFSYGQDFEFVQQFEGISYSSAFYQNYLYYSPGDRIYVLDVSDSENIQHLDTVFQTEHTYYLLADTLNELLYSSRYGKTFIYSLSDPANPVRAGEIERGGSKVIRSDSLLIVGWSLNIWIYDISDLEQPVLLSSLTLEDSYGNICLNRNMLYSYMQPGFSGPQYIIGHDISDPASPQYISLIIIGDPNDPSPVEMEAYDDKIFLARKDELKIFDIADQDTIIHLVDFFFPAESFAFKIKDELLYAALSTGMSIYDISDIYNISWLGQYEWGDQYGNIDVNGSLASLGYPPFGQKIITIDDPENMEEKYYNPNTADVHQVCKNNNLAYFCNWRIGIQVVDISNPLEPFNLDSLPFRPMHFMKFHDDFLYLKRINRDTIHIIDVGNPWRINYCGYVSFENHTNDYTFYDNMLLVNELDHGIRFIDISDPYSPFEVGFEAVGGSGIEVAEDYLYQFSNSSSNDAIISTF
ncbi:MAG: hypothetical protein U9R60_08315, partial [Bacteroidota bacterium]|nr:hypothetical protein [Bacteroidota bacterium]